MDGVQGYYEAEVVDEKGEIVQYWKSRNTVSYGFVGGLFKHMFNVGTQNIGISEPNKTPYKAKAQFGYLYLLKTQYYSGSGSQILASEPDGTGSSIVQVYNGDLNGTGTKKLSDGIGPDASEITSYSVTMDTSTSQKKITLVVQVTFAPLEGIFTSETTTTWYSMAIGSITDNDSQYPCTSSKLISRVLMGSGITKTQTQTLRVRYNFTIVVQT